MVSLPSESGAGAGAAAGAAVRRHDKGGRGFVVIHTMWGNTTPDAEPCAMSTLTQKGKGVSMFDRSQNFNSRTDHLNLTPPPPSSLLTPPTSLILPPPSVIYLSMWNHIAAYIRFRRARPGLVYFILPWPKSSSVQRAWPVVPLSQTGASCFGGWHIEQTPKDRWAPGVGRRAAYNVLHMSRGLISPRSGRPGV